MNHRLQFLFALLPAFTLVNASHAMPGTWNDPIDGFVTRAGPQSRVRFAKGELGILLPSYGREPLYEAFRALTLPRALLEKEDDTPLRVGAPDQDAALPGWLAARAEIKSEPPRRELDLYRRHSADSVASFVNCTPGAFELATRVLTELKQVRDLTPRDVREWLDAQDAVFEFCVHVPGTASPPVVPALLPAKAPARLQHLRRYQIAAAHFYGGQYALAQSEFAAIAEIKEHPLRQWAALAALRSTLREASLDFSFERRYIELKRGNLPTAAREAAIGEAAKEYNARQQTAMASIESRAKALLANAEWATIHPAVEALVRQAITMLQPWRALGGLSRALDATESNPYTHRTLSRWADLADKLMDYGPPGPAVATLRERFVYFDWIRTIQGCTDNPASPNYTGRCEQEHEHALEMWTRGGARAWLVATLVTAQRATPANQAAVEAAVRTPSELTGALTLHYHAARALRAAGRVDEARALIDRALASSPAGTSSVNLLKQQRVSMSGELKEMLPFLLRTARSNSSLALAADGDELFNRRLSTEDLLVLAADPATPAPLQRQLAVAAWFRADLAEKFDVADQAARIASAVVPTLRPEVERYLAQRSPDDKHAAMLWIALGLNVSPQAFRGPHTQFAQPRRRGTPGDAWCSFNSADAAKAQRVERMLPLPALRVDNARRDAEMARLNAAGSGPQWFARQAFAVVKRQPDDRNNVRLLKAVIQSVDNDHCPHPNADAVRREAERLLAKLS